MVGNDQAEPLSDHIKEVVLLAWARSLDLPDETLIEASRQARPARVEIASDKVTIPGSDQCIATFIRLFNVNILYGPTWLLDAARDVDDEVLALESTLLRLGASHGGRSLGEAALYYLEDPLEMEPSSTLAVSNMAEHVTELEQLCPADDVLEAGLSELDHHFVLVPADAHDHVTGKPVAGSGFEVWESLIAVISTLTDPQLRRNGLGNFATGVAIEEAFVAGLIPQWKAPMGHSAAQKLADSLGFRLAGSQTTVFFDKVCD